ncbi:DUF4249 domain-containing protein [Pontibacter sp. JH31]|uniref:DUF4249 domain-containing protein n=1 Tax=Pontibacter aquaedesilientis TaxID=2766980 RepID=A0ABR7XFG6_9BACT|nr:DUF4249 domain-containing protein [Pontibacter aquaedesilientis]MBD1397050.1 DUF4249 domain-containing protein [Pontibacter aquaedesilientis]
MKIKHTLYTLIPLLLLLLACDMEQEVEINLPPHQSQLVVECYLEPGKPLRAVVLESVSYFSNPQLPIVPDAEVFLTHKGRTVKLAFSPFQDRVSGKYFTHRNNKPLDLKAGDVVTIEVKDKKDRRVTGSTTILKRVPIEAVEWKFNEKGKAYLLTSFQDDPDAENYYRYMTHRDSLSRGTSRDFVSSDQLTNGKRISYGSAYDFEKGDTLIVSLYHIEKDYYNFLNSISDAKNANGNPFAQPSRIVSSVQGGIGIFTNLAYERKTVIIQ